MSVPGAASVFTMARFRLYDQERNGEVIFRSEALAERSD